MKRPECNWDYDNIYDMVALRVIVETVSECYAALGIVHDIYKPIPHLGVSDFIAQPKPNGYQSLHTKIFGPGKKVVEVQIRTRKMHDQAERGIAAHWAYSKSKSKGVSDEVLEKQGVFVSDKLAWVKQLAKWQKEIRDSDEFMKAVKFDALSERIFVFAQNGDVYDLPKGAAPIDFAYAVHTGLGKYIKSAKVNGKVTSLDTKLKSGDVVEIIKTKRPKKPSRDWLRFVATTIAKGSIIKQLRTNN